MGRSVYNNHLKNAVLSKTLITPKVTAEFVNVLLCYAVNVSIRKYSARTYVII